MKRYLITFYGRERGSRGLFQQFSVISEAEDEAGAKRNIFEAFEHVRFICIRLAEDA